MSTLSRLQYILASEGSTHLAPGEITPDMSLCSLGIDSLSAIGLLFELEDEFSITIDERSFETVRDLIVAIDGEAPQ